MGTWAGGERARALPEERNISSITAYAAYDPAAICDAAGTRGAKAVVPPTSAAAGSRRKPRSAARHRTIRRVRKVGRRRWKKEPGLHRQGTAENGYLRYKSILGDRLRDRHAQAQETEALISCNIRNRISEIGMPVSSALRN